MPTEPSRPSPLAIWAIGLALIGCALALARIVGALAIVPFVAGLGLLFVYYLKETRDSRRGGYSLGGSGDPIYPGAVGDHGDDNGGGGDGGGGDIGGGNGGGA